MGDCIATLSGEAAAGSMVGGDGAVKHWTYEDQFKQVSGVMCVGFVHCLQLLVLGCALINHTSLLFAVCFW